MKVFVGIYTHRHGENRHVCSTMKRCDKVMADEAIDNLSDIDKLEDQLAVAKAYQAGDYDQVIELFNHAHSDEADEDLSMEEVEVDDAYEKAPRDMKQTIAELVAEVGEE